MRQNKRPAPILDVYERQILATSKIIVVGQVDLPRRQAWNLSIACGTGHVYPRRYRVVAGGLA